MASRVPLVTDAQQVEAQTKITLGVLHEQFGTPGKGDQRVSIDPTVAKLLIDKEGYTILVETKAGVHSGFSDEAYVAAGCRVVSRADVIRQSQVLFSIIVPEGDFASLRDKVVISWVGRLTDDGKKIVEAAKAAGVTLIDVTAAPRITIAQKLDVLSSQAKVAGHRAVIEATHSYGRFHTAEMTAAGKFPPSQTFVLGCGVAGLAAMGTSKALGSVVRAWDVRDVSDQVHSMGAKWVKVDFKEDGAGQGGYAKESSDAFKKAQQDTFEKVLAETDVAITTAAIPGRRSPLLITKEAVAKMKPGSVIIDLAAVGGGNCELTRKNESYVTPNGITIIGFTDLPARMGNQASAMYAQNMLNLLKHVTTDYYKEGKDVKQGFLTNLNRHLDNGAGGDGRPEGDIVSRSIVCCRGGNLIVMPPPPQPTPVKPKATVAAKEKKAANPMKSGLCNALILTIIVALLVGMGQGVVEKGTGKVWLLTTFLLAGSAGYQAVWGVAHALHTPLMSVTNAISGMTAIGGMLLLDKTTSDQMLPRILAMVAIGFSAVNIIGGFLVSQRLLNLFSKGKTDYSWFMLIPGMLLVVAGLLGDAPIEDAVDSVSAILCIAAIGCLASQSSANTGCKFGMIGVLGCLVVTCRTLGVQDAMNLKLGEKDTMNLKLTLGLTAIGGLVGLLVGGKVTPMQLPQTVAAFHSLVGLAAMLTSIGSFARDPTPMVSMETIAAALGDFIGGVTLTGSLIAFGKLNGNLSSKPLSLPGKNFLNLFGLLSFLAMFTVFLMADKIVPGNPDIALYMLYGISLLSMIMGWHLVGSVGGGDMPVCITVLNSYSGWALVAEGFLLNSSILTIVGALIGFSGAILTKIMCDAMNRDIFNVIFGGLNNAPVTKAAGDDAPKIHVEASVTSCANLLADAKKVLVVPGYGMAMSRAQGAMGDLANVMRGNGAELIFGVHPVAGRMPGQMNVLLAEAGVPHEWVLEMDEVNPVMAEQDVVIVLGANDVVNSNAQELEGCAIWGMPVIEVWKAKKVIFCKRSMATGYADLENPVFFKENTEMLLGDGKKTADALVGKMRELFESKA